MRRSTFALLAFWAGVAFAMLAPPGGSIQPFYNALRDFTRIYGGKKASTQDFQKIMERQYKMDLGWFFDETLAKVKS